jgi:hypothetical protein
MGMLPVHHEQSETVQRRDGKWINIYGKKTPQAGEQLPGTQEYDTVEEAVNAAKERSRGMLHPRRTPSELYQDTWPSFAAKTKRPSMPEDFLSAPVTQTEREILRLAPRGMLHDLNKQALDRELNSVRLFNAVRRYAPKSM